MLYFVEIRRVGTGLAASMAEMRTWFDNQQINPTVFDHSSGSPGITFQVGLMLSHVREALQKPAAMIVV
jgi:hypothetical protein